MENADANARLPDAPPKLEYSLPEGLLDKIKAEITCVVCMDLALRPCTLPCGHTACRRCLNEHLSRGSPADQKRCPTCRTLLPVGMPPLALNTTLKSLAELLLPEECKECTASPPDARRPPTFQQRVLLNTGARAVSLHTTEEINAQATRSAVAGLNALLEVMAERWPAGHAGLSPLEQAMAALRQQPTPPRAQPAAPQQPTIVQPRWNSAQAAPPNQMDVPRTTRTVAGAAQRTPLVTRAQAAPARAAASAPRPQQRTPGSRLGAGATPPAPSMVQQQNRRPATNGNQGASPSPQLRRNVRRAIPTASGNQAAAAAGSPAPAPAQPGPMVAQEPAAPGQASTPAEPAAAPAPAPAPAPNNLRNHMRAAAPTSWNSMLWGTVGEMSTLLEFCYSYAVQCCASTVPGQALLAARFVSGVMEDARAGREAPGALASTASQLFITLSQQIGRHMEMAEAANRRATAAGGWDAAAHSGAAGGQGPGTGAAGAEVQAAAAAMLVPLEWMDAGLQAMLAGLALPEVASHLSQAALAESIATTTSALAATDVFSAASWPGVHRQLNRVQEKLLESASALLVMDALLCLLRAPLSLTELWQIVPAGAPNHTLYMEQLAKLLVKSAAFFRRDQTPDLRSVLMTVHELMGAEPHPDATIADMQKRGAKRFVGALCRAVEDRGILPHLANLPTGSPLIACILDCVRAMGEPEPVSPYLLAANSPANGSTRPVQPAARQASASAGGINLEASLSLVAQPPAAGGAAGAAAGESDVSAGAQEEAAAQAVPAGTAGSNSPPLVFSAEGPTGAGAGPAGRATRSRTAAQGRTSGRGGAGRSTAGGRGRGQSRGSRNGTPPAAAAAADGDTEADQDATTGTRGGRVHRLPTGRDGLPLWR